VVAKKRSKSRETERVIGCLTRILRHTYAHGVDFMAALRKARGFAAEEQRQKERRK